MPMFPVPQMNALAPATAEVAAAIWGRQVVQRSRRRWRINMDRLDKPDIRSSRVYIYVYSFQVQKPIINLSFKILQSLIMHS